MHCATVSGGFTSRFGSMRLAFDDASSFKMELVRMLDNCAVSGLRGHCGNGYYLENCFLPLQSGPEGAVPNAASRLIGNS